MSIFLESIWVWLGLAFLVAAIGYGFFLNDRRIQTLGITVVSTILVLALGLSLYYFVDTDRKSVSRMLTALASDIEKDDLDDVLKLIEPKALGTRGLARLGMGRYRVTQARFQDLKVEVNELTSPPTAKVSFSAVFYWKPKDLSEFPMEQPMLQVVKFNVELAKTPENTWLVTDKCETDIKI